MVRWFIPFLVVCVFIILDLAGLGASVDLLEISVSQVCSLTVSHRLEVFWKVTASGSYSITVELVGPDGTSYPYSTVELSGSYTFEIFYPQGGTVTVKVTVQEAMSMASSSRGIYLSPCATITPQPRCYPDLPNPELAFLGTEDFIGNDGREWRRYLISVINWRDYPNELFASSPDLPPCGRNPNASRTWVDIYSGDGSRLYGFCALVSPESLQGLWFALPRDRVPPSCVYVTLTDRRCGITYTSNCVFIPGEAKQEIPVLLISGSASGRHPGGGDIILEGVGGLEGYENATVFLNGFYFSCPEGDHHINEIKLQLRDASFDKNRGIFSWIADLAFGDGGEWPFNEDFNWRYSYLVAAFSQGEVRRSRFEGRTHGKRDLSSPDIWDPKALQQSLALDGFRLDFLGTEEETLATDNPKDHHLNEIKVELGERGEVIFADWNYDDEFYYAIPYQVLKSPHISVIERQSPQVYCDSPSLHIHQQIQIPEGYRYATVLLRGWRFDFAPSNVDHHIKTIGLAIENERFDPVSRTLSWDVSVEYCDEEFDPNKDTYYFQYWYSVVAFKDARIEKLKPAWVVTRERGGVRVRTDCAIFGEPDEDGDGLSDIWENLFMWTVNPYFVLDEEEMWYRRELHNVVNFVRVSPYPSRDDPRYVITYFLNTWARDYGYQYWIDEYTHSHNGDTEPIIMAWKVFTDHEVELQYVYFSRHGCEEEIKEGTDVEFLNSTPKFYVSESKHAIYPHCGGGNNWGCWDGKFLEDCGDGGTFRFPCYNVGEPGHQLITGSLLDYGFAEDIRGLCDRDGRVETCGPNEIQNAHFCGGLGWDGDCAAGILTWLFHRWVSDKLRERLR